MNQQSEVNRQSQVVRAHSINNILQRPVTTDIFSQKNNSSIHCRKCNREGLVAQNGVCSHCGSGVQQLDEFKELQSTLDLFRENFTKLCGAIDKEVEPLKLQQLNESITWAIRQLQGTKSQLSSQLFKNPTLSNIELICPQHRRTILAVCIDPRCNNQPSSCLDCIPQHNHPDKGSLIELTKIRQKLQGIQTTYTGLININIKHQELTSSLIGYQELVESKLQVSINKLSCMSQIDYLLTKCSRSSQDHINYSPQLSQILQRDNGFVLRFDPMDDNLTKSIRRMETILQQFNESMAQFQRDMNQITF